jgi:hypothetical protein
MLARSTELSNYTKATPFSYVTTEAWGSDDGQPHSAAVVHADTISYDLTRSPAERSDPE